MDCPGHELLADTGFTVNQDRGVGGGHLLDAEENILQSLAFSDDLREIPFEPDLLLEVEILLLEL